MTVYWGIIPFTPKMFSAILLTVCHTIVMMIVWIILSWINQLSPTYSFLYSHHWFTRHRIDILRRNSVLITHGSYLYRVNLTLDSHRQPIMQCKVIGLGFTLIWGIGISCCLLSAVCGVKRKHFLCERIWFMKKLLKSCHFAQTQYWLFFRMIGKRYVSNDKTSTQLVIAKNC